MIPKEVGVRSCVMSVILLSVVAFLGCQNVPRSADEITTERDLTAFLNRLEKRYESSCVRMGQTNWNLYWGEGTADFDVVKAEFANILLDSLNREIVDHWRYSASEKVDPKLRRRLEVWAQCFLGAYGEENEEISALEHSLNERDYQFQFTLDGQKISRDELNRIIRTDPNPERRRQAWGAFGLLSREMEDDLRRLLQKRNKGAEFLGREIDYGTFSLMVQSINADWLKRLIDRLEEQTREPYRQFVDSLKEE